VIRPMRVAAWTLPPSFVISELIWLILASIWSSEMEWEIMKSASYFLKGFPF